MTTFFLGEIFFPKQRLKVTWNHSCNFNCNTTLIQDAIAACTSTTDSNSIRHDAQNCNHHKINFTFSRVNELFAVDKERPKTFAFAGSPRLDSLANLQIQFLQFIFVVAKHRQRRKLESMSERISKRVSSLLSITNFFCTVSFRNACEIYIFSFEVCDDEARKLHFWNFFSILHKLFFVQVY